MGTVDESIEDAIGDCGVSDHLMPHGDWVLTGDQGGAAAVRG